MENKTITIEEGLYLCGKEPYFIYKNSEGKLVVENPDGIISANSRLFWSESPLTLEEVRINQSLFDTSAKQNLLERSLRYLSGESLSLPKCTNNKSLTPATEEEIIAVSEEVKEIVKIVDANVAKSMNYLESLAKEEGSISQGKYLLTHEIDKYFK